MQQKEIVNIESPCIRNCCLNQIDICLGCFRHIDEIVDWRSYSTEKKQNVLKSCQQRQTDYNSKCSSEE